MDAHQQRSSAGMQHRDHAEEQQQQPAINSLLDIPNVQELLVPHLQDLTPQHRLALLQSCRALRDLAVSTAPQLQLSISITRQGCCTHGSSAATAAWAATLCPALHLLLQHPLINTSNLVSIPVPPAALAVGAAITPQLGQMLTALTLQGMSVDALVPAAVATSCPALQRLYIRDCNLPSTSAPKFTRVSWPKYDPASSSPCAYKLALCSRPPPATAAAAAAAKAAATPRGVTSHARLQHLSIISTPIRLRTQLAALVRLPSLSSLELDQWPDVALEDLPRVGQLSSQLTALAIICQTARSVEDGDDQDGMFQSLSMFTALRELRVASEADFLFIQDERVEQWFCSMLHLASLQLPQTRIYYIALLQQHLDKLQHLCTGILSLDTQANDPQQCRCQSLQLGLLTLTSLCCLPLLPCLVEPLSVTCLSLHWHEKHLVQQAVARFVECGKPGLKVHGLELDFKARHHYDFRAGGGGGGGDSSSSDDATAMSRLLQEAAPLVQLLATRSMLSLVGGNPTSAVLRTLSACGVQGHITHLKLDAECVPTACFWEAAPHVLRSVRRVTLDLSRLYENAEQLVWLRGPWVAIVAYLCCIPGPVDMLVQFYYKSTLQSVAPFMRQSLQGAAHVHTTLWQQICTDCWSACNH